jgi:sulfite exporter TauE/SafE/copper chaperone CopZ
MKNFMQKELTIKGMTCSGCERRIETALLNLNGISKVRASFRQSKVELEYDESLLNLDKIIATIEVQGYRVDENQEADSTGKLPVNHLLGIIIILLAFYLMISNSQGFNFIPPIDQSMGYGILFLVGLMTSLHCIAMCGGINLSQCVAIEMDGNNIKKYSNLKPSLLYNSGRVLSYTIIGGIVGALGSVVSFSGAGKGAVAIIAGAFMIIMGLNMLNLFPWLRKIIPSLPVVFGNKIYNNNGKRPFWVGMLNGFMPCGPLQAMQLYALASGSFWAGATSMLVFSLGTVPLMFGFGALSSFLSSKYTRQILKVSAILVIFLGMIMLNRGFNLSGFNTIAAAKSNNISAQNVAKIEGNVQMVTTTLDNGSYKPIIVQKGIPVKWTIKATPEGLNGCNNPVTIPKYNIQKELIAGDNLIEFTPQAEGDITYTCWMGMISSNIKVVADLDKLSAQDMKQNNTIAPTSSGGGCCSASTNTPAKQQTAPRSLPACCRP